MSTSTVSFRLRIRSSLCYHSLWGQFIHVACTERFS